MLAYRHLFHAGNFADVFKHALLARLLIALGRKDKPYRYLDTHAGTGLYDLTHPWAQKNAEWRDGIERVLARKDAPAALAPYLEAVRAENPNGRLRYYPGSPRIARRLVRAGDRLVLNELNSADFEELKGRFAGDRQVTVHRMDGYQALKAFLPPPQRRGLVLVDSSFDRSGEFARLAQALAGAHRRWATGVFALWYPMMEPGAVRAFERDIVATGIRKILRFQLAVLPERWTRTLRGSALLVVNPPYGLEAEAGPLLDWLWRVLSPGGEGGCALEWLVPE
jgi:23S rRNA (adenine2030-N6)-methyltransferase